MLYKGWLFPLNICCLCLVFHGHIYAQESLFYFDIPSQGTDISLVQYAKITDRDVIYPYEEVSTFQSTELVGYYTADDAIKRLLKNTTLFAELDLKGVLVVNVDLVAKGKSKSKIKSFFKSLFGLDDRVQRDDVNGDVVEKNILEEIIVTVQKRRESLADIPLAVSILNSQKITNSFSNSIEGLQTIIPSVTLRKGNTSRNSSVFIRGVGTFSFSIAAEPSVSTVLDGVVLARSGQAFADVYDVERIEILRGSQGTLFGKNASAGVVNIITKTPTDEFQGDLDVSFFQGREHSVKASLSGPLSDNIKSRVATYLGSFDGSHINTFNGEDVNGYRRKGIRSLFDYTSTENLDIRFSFDYFESNDDCCIELTADRLADQNDVIDSLRMVNHDRTSRSLDRALGSAVTLNWDLGEASLVSITAYREWDNTEDSDRDFMSSVGSVFRSNQPNEFQLHEIGVQKTEQISQELRLTSASGEDLEYSVGLFYFDVNSGRQFKRDDVLCLETSLANDICEEGMSTFIKPSATADMTSSFENFAVFGQGAYSIVDDWRLVVGLRWTRDKVNYTHRRIGNQDHRSLIVMQNTLGNPVGFGAPGIQNQDFSGSGSQSETNLSYKFVVQHDVTEKLMAYATYGTGFKGPAFDVSFSFSEARSEPVGPEESESIELGMKGTFLDGSVFTSLAVYYAELDGFQMNSAQLLNNNITSNLSNVGVVQNSGLEFDLIANISSGLKVFGGLSYMKDAKINDIFCFGELSLSEECLGRENERLMLSPKLKASLGIDYLRVLNNDFFNLHVSTEYSYQGDMFSDDKEDPLELIESYSLLNASIGLSSKNGLHKLNFIAKNIEDKSYPTQVICCSIGSEGDLLRYQIPRNADRYFGLNYKIIFH